MAHTFFEGRSAYAQDQISLTRFAGGPHGTCLQITTRRFKESLDCPVDQRERAPFPGWSHVSLTRDEVVTLRDQLTRFLEGDVSDASPEETF